MDAFMIGEFAMAWKADDMENAAESAFNNGAYSKIDVFILQVISQYRADKIGPYYTYGSDTNSIYYKENQKIIQLLKEAEKLSDKNLGSGFSNFEICPSSDLAYKMLAKGELVGDEIERHALDKIKWLVQVYNKEAQQAISAKINKL